MPWTAAAKKPITQCFFIAIAATLATLGAQAAPTLYKWIDENGQVRYSDRLSADQARQRHQTLTKDGRVLETMDRKKTPEELRREREEAKQREEEAQREAERKARLKAEQDHKDRVLMMTYTSEEEIRLAEQERIDVIDSVIKLLHRNIANEQNKLEGLEQRAQTQFIDKDKEIPGGLAQNIEYFKDKLLNRQKQLELKLEEKERIKQQYATDLLRYRELSKKRSPVN
jgi:hypothetical protein